MKLDLAGLLGEPALIFGQLGFLREDARLARIELAVAGVERDPLVAGALVLDVDFGLTLVELALPLLVPLPGLVKLLLPRAARGRFEVQGVKLGALLGKGELQLDFLSRGRTFTLPQFS